MTLFAFFLHSSSAFGGLDDQERSVYSHFLYVLHSEVDSSLHPGEEQSPQGKRKQGGGGEVEGSFFAFSEFPISPRVLQNPPPDEQTLQQMCRQQCVLGCLGLFKLGFSCTKGFCEIGWVFVHRFPASNLERLRN